MLRRKGLGVGCVGFILFSCKRKLRFLVPILQLLGTRRGTKACSLCQREANHYYVFCMDENYMNIFYAHYYHNVLHKAVEKPKNNYIRINNHWPLWVKLKREHEQQMINLTVQDGMFTLEEIMQKFNELSEAPPSNKEENGGEESRVGSRQSKRNANKVVLYNDDYSDDDILPPKKGKRSRKRDSEDSNFSDSADDAKSKKKRRRSKKKKAKLSEVEETNSEEEDSSEAKSSTKRSKAKEKTKKQADGKKEKSDKLMNRTESDYESIDFSSDKTTPDGKEWNFKISTWNVGGLKAWVKKNGMEFLKHENPDIFCMQETKCSEDKLPDEVKVEGYHTYWVSGEKEGYAGVGLYTKQEPINVTYGLGNKEYDTEGRLITAEFEKFYLVAIYVPNAGRGLVNLPKRMKWDPDLRKYLKELDSKKPVIICGDMNVSHEAIDLANPKTNTKNAGFTQEERDGMTALLSEGFIDSFRQLYPEKTGAYSFWTYMGNARSRNVGWRLDYFILSKQLLPNLCDSIIRSEVYGSDHCPITLLLHI